MGKHKCLMLDGDKLLFDPRTTPRPFGSDDDAFIAGMANQMINVVTTRQTPNDTDLNNGGSIISGIAPRDELEGMLALQMLAVHNATITFARRLAHVESISQQESAEKAFNKLARTFTLQVQALQKYRSGGKQKVVVKHVHVNDGGQAIVGNVNAGGDDGSKK